MYWSHPEDHRGLVSGAPAPPHIPKSADAQYLI